MVNGFSAASFRAHRGKDAKRHSFLRLIEFGLFRNIVDKLSLNLRNILISPFEGEKKFLTELGDLRNFKEGFNLKRSCRNSNSDRRLYFLKNINHNSDMLHHDKNNKGRLGILAQREAGFEPSPEFLSSPQLTKKFNPLTKREGSDSVISNNYSDTNHSQLTTHYSLISDTVFSRFTSHFSLKRKTAFTLAEVLITIGIIGIVAAMTLPSLITKYKIHELRTRFQKTNSIVNQALKYTLNDLGLSDYSDMNLFNLPNGSQASIYEPVYKEYNQVWEKQFKGAKKLGRQEILDNINPNHLSTFPLFTKTFWGKPADWGHLYATSGNLAPTYYLLPDGSLIGQIDAFGTCYASCTIATIFFDTNGPYKGPNRYGYDFFYFDAGIDGQSIFKCGINEANDRTCFYRYALRDQNPFNTSKTYWDNLYKPKSFFEK